MKESFAELLELLSNSPEPVATARLAELSDLNAVELGRFTRVWRELSSERRQTLLVELGVMADAQIELTFEPINRMAMDDSDPVVRLQAIENLWECEDPTLVGPLLGALQEDSSEDVRATAGKALGTFVFIGETRELAPQLQHDIEEVLLAATQQDPADTVRDQCLQSLGYSSRKEVADLIDDAYHSQHDARLRSALRAMARSANRAWGPQVMAQLHHPEPSVRREAVQAAGELNIREGAPELVDLLEDVDPKVRRAAIWSLSQVGGPRAAEALAELSEEDDEEERRLLRDALDNLAFVEGTRDLLIFDLNDPPDLPA